ncbi:hypothetical protein SAMN02745866_00248 [Alteromonadaceae bacterium Bs31]|nr:hypothetical protein SAMN02745866_00248 [Alteromonadaceae bacterium Bs31]
MSERKEPTINAIRPEQDEIRNRPKASQARAGAAQVPPARPVIVKSRLAPLALFVALVGVGLAAFAYWQLMEAQKQLVASETRILDLESRLEMSGDESTASMAAMQAKLKWADSEIRKLWGVSYDRNKKSIEKNTEQLAVLSKGAKSVEKKIAAALKAPNTEIKLINDLLDSQQSSMSAIESKTQAQLSQVQELSDKMRQLEKMEAEFKRRITSNEEAIQAIDAFRRSVNKQLLEQNSGAALP